MDFDWSEDQARLREAAVEVGRGIGEGLVQRDREEQFDHDGWKRLGQFGVHGMPVPTEYGGLGLDMLTTVGVLERLGYACRDAGLLFSLHAHLWTAVMPVLHFGTDEQRRRFLPGLCDGSVIGGNAMSEPESGSDAFAMRTTAVRRGDRYVLNGTKVFATNAPIADLLIVFANLDPAQGARGVTSFLVERDTPGFRIGRKLEKMGLRTSPMAELFFDDCEIPVENRLGREGGGANLFTQGLTWERAFIVATGVGAMERLLERSIEYARMRKQFGQPIGKFQLVSSKIIDMKLRLETSRALLFRAAWLRARGKSIFLEGALAKLHISEAWVATAQDALQIHGGWGYMTELELERELRDAIGSRLHSGTSEIQRVIAGPLLGL